MLIEFLGNAYNEPTLASDELADAPVLSIAAELTDPAGGGSLARGRLTPR